MIIITIVLLAWEVCFSHFQIAGYNVDDNNWINVILWLTLIDLQVCRFWTLCHICVVGSHLDWNGVYAPICIGENIIGKVWMDFGGPFLMTLLDVIHQRAARSIRCDRNEMGCSIIYRLRWNYSILNRPHLTDSEWVARTK